MSNPYLTPAAALLQPGLVHGLYPERPQQKMGGYRKVLHGLAGFSATLRHHGSQYKRTLLAIHECGRELAKADDQEIDRQIVALRRRLGRRGFTEQNIIAAFALVRQLAGRTLGMYHYDTQLMGGLIMVQGRLAEMETGEGKTLTATLAAATMAIAGIPVHIITVNEYLVERDVRLLQPLYRRLGLSVSAVTGEMDAAARRQAYRANISYCTNKQLAFDYLRDRIALGDDHGRLRLQLEAVHQRGGRIGQIFLPGLYFALIDEADSVLIDEARTPLVISRARENTMEKQVYAQAMEWADSLKVGSEFQLDSSERAVQLTESGRAVLEQAAAPLGGVWSGARRREELVHQALAARHLYQRDYHYIVRDQKVQIIDQNTGRVMADRLWERGLHQMIELKEQCVPTDPREQVARLTYQRFFRRYLRLAGMTGTGREVRRELWAVYHLQVVPVPPHKPCRRRNVGQRIYADRGAKWAAVVHHVQQLVERGRPVLAGTRSVSDSEHLSRLLQEHGVRHRVLNARQDAEEAEIIAEAGQQGVVTVATNMAGRGTDIPLGEGVATRGGLHIIACERNEARRIDRQLFGRCGRQGDPGSHVALLSLDDELPHHYLPGWLRSLLCRFCQNGGWSGQKLALLGMVMAQAAQERYHRQMRQDLLQYDEQLSRMLSFTGRLE